MEFLTFLQSLSNYGSSCFSLLDFLFALILALEQASRSVVEITDTILWGSKSDVFKALSFPSISGDFSDSISFSLS